MIATLVHRFRRRQRQAAFADLDLHVGDKLSVLLDGIWFESKIADLEWQMNGERRFAILKNGFRIRVGAPPAVGAAHYSKVTPSKGINLIRRANFKAFSRA